MGRKTNVGPLGSAELMSGAELMNGTKSRKWVHQKPTNQPTNQPIKMDASISLV